MAKRDRISNRKSLGAGKNHKRNKNPKLSPFQREQKRDRLANQPPVEKQKRDFPAKQRMVFHYFHEKSAREEAKKEAKRLRDEEEGIVEDINAMGKARRRKMARLESSTAPHANGGDGRTSTPNATPSKTELKKGMMRTVPSLNEELREGTAPIEERMDMNVIRRKEKKHEKRVEQRRERIAQRMNDMESELSEALRRNSKKGRKNDAKSSSTGNSRDDQYEREIVKMQREKAKEDAAAAKAMAAAKAAEHAAGVGSTAAQPSRKQKRISFDEEVAAASAAKHTVAKPKPRDFYHMVDVVRYGERVDAPPVFESIPDKNSAVSKLAAKLSAEEEAALQQRKKPTSFAERKRLAALGLGPRVSGTTEEVSTEHDRNKCATNSMASEFEKLRAKVLESYQKNKVQRYQQQKLQQSKSSAEKKAAAGKVPVDLKHQFPLI